MMPSAECPCTGKNLNKLLHPSIFAVLAGRPLHGYRIVELVSELALLRGKKPDSTGVYRTLKGMEESGLLVSSWDVSSGGPARRLYRLTPEGKRCLVTWVRTLREYEEAIGELLALAKKAAAKGRQRSVRRPGNRLATR